jgi:2-polyprenyl-3-methyl-5-hydroxy-6-metoxy-1,4-benzoquinol methylase
MIVNRTTCRVCNGSLEPILSLGDIFISNFLVPGEPDGVKSPLELALCQRCYLLQLNHTVPAQHLYQNYWYRSGTNQTMREALADIAQSSEQLIHLQKGDAVLDIGCNDGTLLHSYKTDGIYKIGIDPAKNVVMTANQMANKVISDFFTAELFRNDPELVSQRPRIITSIAMFYDLEDPKKFVADVKEVMHPDGVWVIQMSYLPMMLKTNELGNICHEHLEYYSLQSLEYLLNLFDLEIVDAEINNVNGGSIRTYIRSRFAYKDMFGDGTYRALALERIKALQEDEKRLGLDNKEIYKDFAFWVERIKNDVVSFIQEKAKQGKKVYVYGASTKGNTVLQYYGLDHTIIKAAAERNPDKWGKVTVGTHIPIVSEEEARAAKPDYFLVLPWHFLEEFKVREKEYLLSGGRFILPAPYFSVI